MEGKNKERKVSYLIPDSFSCHTHRHHILATNKFNKKNKSKKKLQPLVNDDFHAHLVVNNLKLHKLNIHGELNQLLSFVHTEESYMLYQDSDFKSMRLLMKKEFSTN